MAGVLHLVAIKMCQKISVNRFKNMLGHHTQTIPTFFAVVTHMCKNKMHFGGDRNVKCPVSNTKVFNGTTVSTQKRFVKTSLHNSAKRPECVEKIESSLMGVSSLSGVGFVVLDDGFQDVKGFQEFGTLIS